MCSWLQWGASVIVYLHSVASHATLPSGSQKNHASAGQLSHKSPAEILFEIACESEEKPRGYRQCRLKSVSFRSQVALRWLVQQGIPAPRLKLKSHGSVNMFGWPLLSESRHSMLCKASAWYSTLEPRLFLIYKAVLRRALQLWLRM